MELGTLLRTKCDLIVRKDGFSFSEADVAGEGGSVDRDWLSGADMFNAGVLCTFLRLAEDDPSYAVVARDIMGRVFYVKLSDVETLSKQAE